MNAISANAQSHESMLNQMVPETGLDAEARSAETQRARRAKQTCTPLREEDFKYSREGRRINVYLIRCPFPFTRVTRSALQSEGYGHPDGHLFST